MRVCVCASLSLPPILISPKHITYKRHNNLPFPSSLYVGACNQLTKMKNENTNLKAKHRLVIKGCALESRNRYYSMFFYK